MLLLFFESSSWPCTKGASIGLRFDCFILCESIDDKHEGQTVAHALKTHNQEIVFVAPNPGDLGQESSNKAIESSWQMASSLVRRHSKVLRHEPSRFKSISTNARISPTYRDGIKRRLFHHRTPLLEGRLPPISRGSKMGHCRALHRARQPIFNTRHLCR